MCIRDRPKLVPLALVMLLYFLFAKKNFTPIKGIVLMLVIGIPVSYTHLFYHTP